MQLGNAGDSNTMIRLYCELQGRGWTLVRKGWREGLPKDKAPIWVFCPLLKAPRDRNLVEECKKCKHFKSISHSTSRTQQQTKEESFKFTMIPARKDKPSKPSKKSFTEIDLEKAIEEQKKTEKEWLEEEKRIFEDKTDETKGRKSKRIHNTNKKEGKI